MLPAAGIFDGLAAQHSRSPVEVEEIAGPRSRSMFQDEMAVKEERFHLGKKVEIAIEIAPPGLHDSDSRVREMVNRPEEKLRRRHKIGVEYGDELAVGCRQTLLQRASLEAFPMRPLMILN